MYVVAIDFSSTIVGLTTIKRDKYSIFNFLSFPSQEDVEPEKQHHMERAEMPTDKGTAAHLHKL